MENNEISQKRAGEIALKALQYRVSKRKLELDPGDGQWLAKKAKKYEITLEDATLFMTHVVLPIAVIACTNRHGSMTGIETPAMEERCGEIALKIMRSESILLDPAGGAKQLRTLAKNAKVPFDELVQLYLVHIIPRTTARIAEDAQLLT